MNDYRKEASLGSINGDDESPGHDSSEPRSSAAETFERKARQIRESFGAFPAVRVEEPPENTNAETSVTSDAVAPVVAISPLRKGSSTAIKTAVDMDPRYTSVRKTVEVILKPLSIHAHGDNGLQFYKVYLDLCVTSKEFPQLLADWLNDRLVRLKKAGDEKLEDYVVIGCAEEDLNGIFPVVPLVKAAEAAEVKKQLESGQLSSEEAKKKIDKIPLVNILPGLRF